jgi:hypothetical protein
MIHWFQIGLILYITGQAITAGLMQIGIALGGERWPAWFAGYDGKFLAFWLVLWPVSLPVVLYLLASSRGPREVDLDEEGVDL